MTRKPESERAVRHGQNEKQETERKRGLHSNVQTFASNHGEKQAYEPGKPRGKRLEFGSMDDVHKQAGTLGRGPTKAKGRKT
jgi:hypothetical protein